MRRSLFVRTKGGSGFTTQRQLRLDRRTGTHDAITTRRIRAVHIDRDNRPDRSAEDHDRRCYEPVRREDASRLRATRLLASGALLAVARFRQVRVPVHRLRVQRRVRLAHSGRQLRFAREPDKRLRLAAELALHARGCSAGVSVGQIASRSLPRAAQITPATIAAMNSSAAASWRVNSPHGPQRPYASH